MVSFVAHRRTSVVKRAAKINRLVRDLVLSFGVRHRAGDLRTEDV